LELSQDQIDTLLTAAQGAMENAHAPYSDFHVGASVLYDDGEIITGCNVENASFGATICAERTALAAGVAKGKSVIKALCVSNKTDTKITPCGICRQVIWEFSQDVPVICSNQNGDYKILTIGELLPHAFDLKGIE
jgi:cytidine deaminase